MSAARHYWLMKSEPSCFSIDHLERRPGQTEHWDGVRNFQVRNMMRDEMRVGDKALFYHSSCAVPGIVGTMEVVRGGYPDFTAWDPQSEHFDPRSTPENPVWYMVDVRLVSRFRRTVTLPELRTHPVLSGMRTLARGNRLSITPVSEAEWRAVLDLAR
ncbi:MAG: EVE domain-containing protein [Acidiferrobacteraceae bacterium]